MPKNRLIEKAATGPSSPAYKALEKKYKEEVARNAQLMEELDKARKARIQKYSGTFSRSKKGFCRVTFGDTHGMRVDKKAFNAFLGDLEIIQPKEIIGMGDHLDCDGFLSSHKAIAYTSLSEYSFAEDVDAANAQFDAIDKICPKARKDYLEGNHEYRIRTWIRDNSKNDADERFHQARYMPDAVLSLPGRGWEFRSRGERHDGLRKRGTIRRGNCLYVHGDSHAKRAAEKHLLGTGMSIVFGHTHRHEAMVLWMEVAGVIGAWNPGCLCEDHPMYLHSCPSTWSQGYGLQFVSSDRFLHINVPIVNGKSLLNSMLKQLGVTR